MESAVFTAWLYFAGTVFFYLSALLGIYPLYLLVALLYFGGTIALLFSVIIAFPQRFADSLGFGSALGPHRRDFYFYQKTDRFGIQSDDSKICVVMVGLPARGKSLIAGKGMFFILVG